jgi:hypothetical protein
MLCWELIGMYSPLDLQEFRLVAVTALKISFLLLHRECWRPFRKNEPSVDFLGTPKREMIGWETSQVWKPSLHALASPAIMKQRSCSQHWQVTFQSDSLFTRQNFWANFPPFLAVGSMQFLASRIRGTRNGCSAWLNPENIPHNLPLYCRHHYKENWGRLQGHRGSKKHQGEWCW